MNILIPISIFSTSALTLEGVWILFTTRVTAQQERRKKDAPEVKAKKLCVVFPSYNDVVDMNAWKQWAKGSNVSFIIAEDVTTLNDKFASSATIIHRNERDGFKAGALNAALDYMVKNSMEFDYVLFFDSDHVPNRDFEMKRLYERLDDHALIQFFYDDGLPLKGLIGWQTYSARFYSNWNIYNRSFGNLIGSAMAVRYDLIKDGLRFPTSITEDYALTLEELTRSGEKVLVMPYTLALSSGKQPRGWKAFFKQQERWSEGTIRDGKNYFFKVMLSKKLTVWDKIDFLFHINLYIQGLWMLLTLSLLFLGIGYSIYIVPIIIFQAIVYLKTLSKAPKIYWPAFLVLNYVMMPIQIYALARGLLLQRGVFYKTDRMAAELPA